MMEYISKVENAVGEWHEKVPHLPATVRQWLADNSWWVALLIVIIGSMVILFILLPLLLLGAILSSLAGIWGAAAGGFLLLLATMWMLLAITSIVLLAVAVSPLKRHKKRGWNLLFVVLLLNVTVIVLKVLFDFELTSFLFGILAIALAGYFLFEMKDHFTPTSARPIEPKLQQ
jgi:hypothetical protein